MSEAVETFRAIKRRQHDERDAAWARRDEITAPIVAAGFGVVMVSEEGRHLRIPIKGDGWFDFWPSSGRWSQSQRKHGQRGARGTGVDALLIVLQAVRR